MGKGLAFIVGPVRGGIYEGAKSQGQRPCDGSQQGSPVGESWECGHTLGVGGSWGTGSVHAEDADLDFCGAPGRAAQKGQ